MVKLSRNLFNSLGLVSMRGRSTSPRAGSQLDVPPTVLFDHVRQLEQAVLGYVADYDNAPSDSSHTFTLLGDHGSGKTHTILYTLAQVEKNAREISEEVKATYGKPVQLYAKADDNDFVALFRALMANLLQSDLLEIMDRFVSNVAAYGDQNHRHTLPTDPTKLGDLLDADPKEQGNRYVDGSIALDETPEIAGPSLRAEEFNRALYYLMREPSLRGSAYDWLCGKPIPNSKRIGVTGPIADPETAVDALGYLAVYCRRAGQPLIIYIDQIEKLVLDTDGSPLTAAGATLRQLVETMAGQKSVLILAGRKESWGGLPEDLQQRLALSSISIPNLGVKEAREILSIYLGGDEERLKGDVTDEQIAPFTPDALLEILAQGGGNTRRLIKIAWAAVERHLQDSKPITPKVIDAVVERFDQDYISEGTVSQEVRRLLKDTGYALRENYSIGHQKIDFALLTVEGDPWLLVEVKHALFHDEEAEQTMEVIELLASLKSEGRPLRLILVVAGYITRSLQERLVEIVDDLIVYSPSDFKRKFSAAVDRAVEVQGSAATARVSAPEWEPRFKQIQEFVADSAQKSQEDLLRIQDKLGQFFERQVSEGMFGKVNPTGLAWFQEERALRSRIEDRGKEQDQKKFEEFQTERNIVVREQRASSLRRAAIASLAALVWLGISAFYASDVLTFQLSKQRLLALDQAYTNKIDVLERSFKVVALQNAIVSVALGTTREPSELRRHLRTITRESWRPGLGVEPILLLFIQKALRDYDVVTFDGDVLEGGEIRVSLGLLQARDDIMRKFGEEINFLTRKLSRDESLTNYEVSRYEISLERERTQREIIEGRQGLIFAALSGLTVLLAIGAGGWYYAFTQRRYSFRGRLVPFRNLSEIDQWAGTNADLAGSPHEEIPSYDPAVRALAARALLEGPQKEASRADLNLWVGKLTDALRRESIGHLRHSQARALGRAIFLGKSDTQAQAADEAPWVESLQDLIEHVPEVLYAFEYWAEREYWKPWESVHRLPARFRVLGAFFQGYKFDQGYRFDVERLAETLAICTMHPAGLPTGLDHLVEAVHGGLTPARLEALAVINDAEIRRAMDDLSPFSDQGLGQFRRLKMIRAVDELYVFLNEWTFYRRFSGDLPGEPKAQT